MPRPHPMASPRSVDLVLADLTDTTGAPIDGRLGMLAAGMLRGGGILAVLTRVRHTADGALVDATGGIVASAQNADLLYLQHIVIPARPLRPPRATDAAAAPGLWTCRRRMRLRMPTCWCSPGPERGNTHACARRGRGRRRDHVRAIGARWPPVASSGAAR